MSGQKRCQKCGHYLPRGKKGHNSGKCPTVVTEKVVQKKPPEPPKANK